MFSLLSKYKPELITGLTGVIPNDYGLITSLYISEYAKEYNLNLAKKLGIDVSTPEKYRIFVKTNPRAYKYPILKHQLGYGLLNPTLGGIIQAHILKNKLDKLQSQDYSEDKRNFIMYKGILDAYNACDDKTNFLKGQVPEEVRPELLKDLETNDEEGFTLLMNSITNPYTSVDEVTEAAMEPNESEIQNPSPEVPDTVADIDPNLVTAPVETVTDEVAIASETPMTEEEVNNVTPLITDVSEMTQDIQNLEDTSSLPETVKEGVEIWKNADEDFSVKIISETVMRLCKGDFSEGTKVSEGDILKTGSEVAKELHDKGVDKTSLTKGVDEIQAELGAMNLAELYSILGELRSLKDSIINFVDYIAEKDDLGLSPSQKTELATEIMNDGLFVDGSDNLRTQVAETLNSSSDFSSRDMSTKLDIFKNFSTEELSNHLAKMSDETANLLSATDSVKTDVINRLCDSEEAKEDAIRLTKEIGTIDSAIDAVECAIEAVQQDEGISEKFAEFSKNSIMEALALSSSNTNLSPFQTLALSKVIDREKYLNRPRIFGGPGSKSFERKFGALAQPVFPSYFMNPTVSGTLASIVDKKFGTNIAPNLVQANDIKLANFLGTGGQVDNNPRIIPIGDPKSKSYLILPKAANFSEGDFNFKSGLAKFLTALSLGLPIVGGGSKLAMNSFNNYKALSDEIGNKNQAIVRMYENQQDDAQTKLNGLRNQLFNTYGSDLGKYFTNIAEGKSSDPASMVTNDVLDYNTYSSVKDNPEEAKKFSQNYLRLTNPKGYNKANPKQKLQMENEVLEYFRKMNSDVSNYQEANEELKNATNMVENPSQDPNYTSEDQQPEMNMFQQYGKWLTEANENTNGGVDKAIIGTVAGGPVTGIANKGLKKSIEQDEEEKRKEARSSLYKRIREGKEKGKSGDQSAKEFSKSSELKDKIHEYLLLENQLLNQGNVEDAIAIGQQINSLKNKLVTSKEFSKEQVQEEQVSKEVIDNALTNDDQIRALVEKYKMLPTLEAKEQMTSDMQALGFTEDIINMIIQYSEGNFSEENVCPNCGQDPCVCASESTEDVTSMIAPELFDELLGPGVGMTDPVDGTLPAGEVQAPGVELGHIGTIEQGIPSGQPVPEEDNSITKVEVINPEGDEFESILR